MRIGIDFGTTRIVVAAVDRGNYPVITFDDSDGGSREWFPPLIALQDGLRVYGWDAWAAQGDPSAVVVRSLKRILEEAGPSTTVALGESSVPLLTLLVEMASALKTALLEHSSLPAKASEPLQVVLGVPANANSNQRFLTVEPFGRAGFEVLGLLNEPSAASIEYGHRARTLNRPELVVVYDLGGGTFDASLVELDGRTHNVIASEGVPFLGGDDFDIVLSDLALEHGGIAHDDLTQAELFRIHEASRNCKETVNPNTRRITVDLGSVREGWPEVSVSAAEYYERCRPLVERTIEATRHLLASHGVDARLDAVYVTGGGSELPLVARALREVFGRKVKRSPYTRSATAIGLAIQADDQAGYVLRERFTRHFGVWREADEGRTVIFDQLFDKGTELPHAGDPPLTISRLYSPVHNIGHFRFIECSHRDAAGRPVGDITVWDEIRFPFDPALQMSDELGSVEVERSTAAATQKIEERYECDASGAVAVTILNLTSGYERRYRLGRWAGNSVHVVPGRRRGASARR